MILPLDTGIFVTSGQIFKGFLTRIENLSVVVIFVIADQHCPFPSLVLWKQ